MIMLICPSMKQLDKDFVVYEGNNRHLALLRKMESINQIFRRLLTDDEIRDYARDWNQKHGSPPLDENSSTSNGSIIKIYS